MKNTKLILAIVLGVVIIVAFIFKGGDDPKTDGPDTENKIKAGNVQAADKSNEANSKVEKTKTPPPNSKAGNSKETPQPKETPTSSDASKTEPEKKTADPKAVEDGQDPMVAINLNNVQMKNIIGMLGDWTGKPIIPVNDAVMGVKITIFAKEKMPRSKALSLLYSAFRSKGYVAEQASGVIYLKPIGEAKSGTVPTVGFDESLARYEDQSQIVEKFFKLEFYSPLRLQNIVAPMLGAYGQIMSDESTGIVTVIETVENLLRVETIINELDVESNTQTITEVFELKHTEPQHLVDTLVELVSDDTRPANWSKSRSTGKPGAATSIVLSEGKTPVRLIPETRRKWIIAKCSPEDMEQVAMWIEELDTPQTDLQVTNFWSIPMDEAIKRLYEWTGKAVLPDYNIPWKYKIHIYASEDTPDDVKKELLYEAFKNRGVAVEESETIIRLKSIQTAKQTDITVLSPNQSLTSITDKSQVVEKQFILEHAEPTRLVQVLSPLVRSYGHITAVDNVKLLSIIETVHSLMRIQEVIARLDVPVSDDVVDAVFEIKHGNAVEIVQAVDIIINTQKNTRYGRSRSSSGLSRPGRGSSGSSSGLSRPGRGSSGTATSTSIVAQEIPINLLAIPTQNVIVASASAEDMDKIEEWIAKLDKADVSEQDQTVVSVRYVDPSDIVSIVRGTLSRMPGSPLMKNVVVEAVRGSKQIVIFGTEKNRKEVEKLVAQIDMPQEEIYEEKTFKLEHADPDKIKENIEGLYEQESGSTRSYRSGSYSYKTVRPEEAVKVISYPMMKQITIIASAENLLKIEDQIKEWDIPLDIEKDHYRLVTLKNSDPKSMVELLSKLFSEEDSSSSGGSFMRYYFGYGNDDNSKKKIVGSLYGLLSFEAVPDTKKIIIMSKVADAYDVVEALIKDLDSQEVAEVPKVIKLNYADAEDLCEQLNGILNESGTSAKIRRSKRGLYEYNVSDDSDGAKSGNTTTKTVNDDISPWWNQGRSSDKVMPLSNLIGKARFIPVQRSKAILVLAPPEYMTAIEGIIEELDEPGMQVMIKAVILEVDHSSMTSMGVQLSSNPGAFGDIGVNAVTALTQIAGNQTRGEFNGGAINTGDLNQGFTTYLNVNVLVDLLQKNINAKVLNQPTLWTKDNEEALFFKGQEVRLLDSNQSDSTGTSTKNSFTPEDVGVTLKVRPSITPEKRVDVTVNLVISEIATELINSQPVINRLETSTKLIVNNGETIVLGGILLQSDSELGTKVPFFGDIPIIGELFKHTDTKQRNNELLVFLTPYVVSGSQNTGDNQYIDQSKEKLEDVLDVLNGLFSEDLEEKNVELDNPQDSTFQPLTNEQDQPQGQPTPATGPSAI